MSASTLPADTSENSTALDSAMSTQPAVISMDTLRRSSSCSVVQTRLVIASRKKYVPPNARVSSRNSFAISAGVSIEEKLPRNAVIPMTNADEAGMNQPLLYTSKSRKTKATVYASTEAAT